MNPQVFSESFPSYHAQIILRDFQQNKIITSNDFIYLPDRDEEIPVLKPLYSVMEGPTPPLGMVHISKANPVSGLQEPDIIQAIADY